MPAYYTLASEAQCVSRVLTSSRANESVKDMRSLHQTL